MNTDKNTISEEYRKLQQELDQDPYYGTASLSFSPVVADIEPALVDNVIAELASITRSRGFFTIHMGPAGKFLADGRNAHLIQKPSSWWLAKLVNHFDILLLQPHQQMDSGLS